MKKKLKAVCRESMNQKTSGTIKFGKGLMRNFRIPWAMEAEELLTAKPN